MTMTPVFSRALVQDLLHGAQATPEQSRLGLIRGSDFQSARVEWLPAAPQSSALDASVLATLVTHPDSPPEPNAEDLQLPRPPSGWLIIASLNTKGVLEMRAFTPDSTDPSGLPIRLF